MRKVLVILTLCVGMAACSGGKTKSTDENAETKQNVVEVLLLKKLFCCAFYRLATRTTLRSVEE